MSELLAIAEFEEETLPQVIGEAAFARLHRLGSQYLNMNPYYVLLLEAGCSAEEARAAFRRMSLQVHPDKHQVDPRASTAFEMVKKSYEKMDDSNKLDLCNRICAGAQKRVDEQIKSARKALKKEGKEEVVPEDDPRNYRRTVRQFVCKMFVEFEQRRAQLESRDANERKRKAEEVAVEADGAKLTAKEAAAWEKSRQKRVAGWRAWSTGSGRGLRKPPAIKAEGVDEREKEFESRGVEWRRDWR